jgi:hypothetical protein
MKMGAGQFFRLDLLGACLYTGVYGGLGFLFGDALPAVPVSMQNAGKALIALVLIGYLGYKAYLYWRQRKLFSAPRVTVQELAEKLETPGSRRPFIVDVRSHGYYDPGALRIKGSIRIEPNNLLAAAKDLPRDQELYVYCT